MPERLYFTPAGTGHVVVAAARWHGERYELLVDTACGEQRCGDAHELGTAPPRYLCPDCAAAAASEAAA